MINRIKHYCQILYWPEGGSETSVLLLGVTGADAVDVVFDAPGISTDFQSSSGSTVRAIKVPTLISFVPSGTYENMSKITFNLKIKLKSEKFLQ